MKLRLFSRLVFFALTLALTGCGNLQNKKTEQQKKPEEPKIANASGDVSYQAFVGRLRKVVAQHDVQTLASMMTPNFGYRLNPRGEGEGVFQYWDENGIWPELDAVLKERFVPSGAYMVAPPQFAFDPDYHGYRAGIAMVNGSWKFAYFVTD